MNSSSSQKSHLAHGSSGAREGALPGNVGPWTTIPTEGAGPGEEQLAVCHKKSRVEEETSDATEEPTQTAGRWEGGAIRWIFLPRPKALKSKDGAQTNEDSKLRVHLSFQNMDRTQ